MDERIQQALENERIRQADNIELIASENYTSKTVRELQGSILTNKYAEGYPGKRYYGGCEFIDEIEQAAIDYARALFGAQFANVQPHCGSSANMAVYRALLQPGDKVLGMNLSEGGHLSHGHPMSFSGQDYQILSYGVDENGFIDFEEVERIAHEEQPRMIIAGASAYSRQIDWMRFRMIADAIGAYLFVDMAHIAGLVAAGLHDNPVPLADVVTTTTHKTLRGPRGGLILTNNEEIAKAVNKAIFPGIQGGPLEHVIAAKAQCLAEAMQPEFRTYQEQVIHNIKAMAEKLEQLGLSIISGGTDNHLILVDVYNTIGITGKEAEELLDRVHITVNKNTIPTEMLSPAKASGIRIGSPAMTTRGFKEAEFRQVAEIIYTVLTNKDNEDIINEQAAKVLELTAKFPMEDL